ncbi:DUF3817 domain-containing protein [Paenibacillus doosanensis]|uniref:DUF3817 domain-containing protein n=1 Tax=Paenibacillus konkukensis TaxID=2020716 RepID=A0ABY4RMT8_9BACL|nr:MULTISPECIES: DUF3817 domain-containing protein [Paenibacillus]MCS7462360.1 DUF3817 domain-containing protein [Paenibacillus doosanensis]UQZ83260.1 hypothetical protein SK3146_02421 [Paenibacillus konkukensis]
MFKTPIGRLRAIGIYEGISFLVLLIIAMPLKYYADFPQPVKYIGMLHGILFILYLLALAHVTWAHRWNIFKVLGAILASLLPFGTFVLDARLRRSGR